MQVAKLNVRSVAEHEVKVSALCKEGGG